MNQELRELQSQAGAVFEAGDVPSSFGNDIIALQSAYSSVALWDRSNWGLLKLGGEDRLRFLHNQTTNDIQRLLPGEGCDTVFVTSTARILDLVTAYVTKEALLLLVSPNRRTQLMEWMDRYIFPMDRVELSDVSDQQAILTLIGPGSSTLLDRLGVKEIFGQRLATHKQVEIENSLVRVAVGSSLALHGYTFFAPIDRAASLWSKLVALGAVPLGDRVWEQLRLQQGRPVADRELTEDYNPLEAGLWQSISFEKGCYIGQETIARLNTYKGVKQRLWGVRLDAPVSLPASLVVEASNVGTLTSHTVTEQGTFGLAYVRTKAGGAGLTVRVGEASGELVAVPFLTHDYYQPDKS